MALDLEAGSREGGRVSALNQTCPDWKIRIADRQCHNDMQVIRQHHDCVNHEGMRLADGANRRTQGAEVLDQCTRFAIGERDRKEVRTAYDKIPPVSDHAGDYPGFRCAQSGLRPPTSQTRDASRRSATTY